MKLIEEEFISPEKDGFNFLGKEENRGEEPYKRYIHFIDLLSRAAKFIYIDKKDWVRVNVRHFKEFSEKSYGEKVFELFLIWVGKVNWTKIPIWEYLTVFAEEYQNKFIDILYCFNEFEVNKKIKIEELVHKLYGNKIEKMESSKEVFDDLITVADVILLKYLKWLGVITTQEKELIPGIGMGRIKKFWIPPKGKNLINRLIDYYVKIGKIQ